MTNCWFFEGILPAGYLRPNMDRPSSGSMNYQLQSHNSMPSAASLPGYLSFEYRAFNSACYLIFNPFWYSSRPCSSPDVTRQARYICFKLLETCLILLNPFWLAWCFSTVLRLFILRSCRRYMHPCVVLNSTPLKPSKVANELISHHRCNIAS